MTDKMPFGGKIKSAKLKKAYYCLFVSLIAVVVFVTVYSLILPAITLTNQTKSGITSHPTLSYLMYNKDSVSERNKSHRAYLEYNIKGANKSETFGVLRQSVMYVYAYAGETICLGSDIVYSKLDANDARKTKPTNVDILMIGPDGTKYTFDNTYDPETNTGKGYIADTRMEKSGPNFTGSNNTDGYTPHEFMVRKTGLYEIRFHSTLGKHDDNNPESDPDKEPHLRNADKKTNSEPVYSMVTNNDWRNSGCTVGAFDATVVSNGEIIPGRVHAKYLAFNIGSNDSANSGATFYADFYIVTNDGYIYHNQYDIDPFGFIFFGNSRGIINTETGFSEYHSFRAHKQDGSAMMVMNDNQPFTIYNPQLPDTDLDKTYMIYFEEPDSDLEGIIYNRAFAPEEVKNLEFIGAKEGNITYVGNGGYFKFDVSNAVSVSISIPFDEYNAQHGTNLENIEINANVVEGTNYVYWDGNDKDGNTVPVGWYRNGIMQVEVRSRAGEFHFPLLDIEGSKGIRIERINKIYEYDDSGTLQDVSNKPEFRDSRYHIYYNNFVYTDEEIAEIEAKGKVDGVDQRRSDSPYLGSWGDRIIGDGLDRSTISNSTPYGSYLMEFKNKVANYEFNSSYYKGDYGIIDMWTYSVSSAASVLRTDIVIEDIEGYKVLNLDGMAFFDKNKNSHYSFDDGDFYLQNVKAAIDYYYCETRWKVVLDRDDPDKIVKLKSTAHESQVYDDDGLPVIDENGNSVKELDYYNHDYEIRLDEDVGKYYVYSYAYNDLKHNNTPTLYCYPNGDPVTVDIITTTKIDEETDEEITVYQVWIPVHTETVTDAVGEYYFSGILINENFIEAPDDRMDKITVSVYNPDGSVYELTTADVHTGDFSESDKGTDTSCGSQVISLSTDVYPKIQADLEKNSKKISFGYKLADVGYYYDTYEKNLTLAKKWGSINDANDIQEAILRLEGYTDNGVVCYEKDVVVNFRSWSKKLNDLPERNSSGELLNYRIVSETFRKGSKYYSYVYDWNDGKGTYYELTLDENLNEISRRRINDDAENEDEREVPPFRTYISEITHYYQYDEISVENWTSTTTTLSVTKYSAIDNNIKLANATFRLMKKDEASGEYEYVRTATGIYAVTTDENGFAVFKGLSDGDYKLVEWVPPENYDKVADVLFTVSAHGSTLNQNVKGSYKDGYRTDVYDALAESPVSKILKVDQYGEPITGASFAIYKADDDFNITDNNPVLTVETDGDGYARFMKTLDHAQGQESTQREMYISELMNELGGRNFVLREIVTPQGFRGADDAHMKIYGDGVNAIIMCENTFESGVWATSQASVYATDYLQMKDTSASTIAKMKKLAPDIVGDNGIIKYVDRNNNNSVNGTLFAVVLKREGAEADAQNISDITGIGWTPVYGSGRNGYHLLKSDENGNPYDLSGLDAVIDCAHRKHGATPFEMIRDGSSTSMHVSLTDFPGYATTYYSYFFQNNYEVTNELPMFMVAYYYTTAETVDGATVDNTVQITSHGYDDAVSFPVYWSTTIEVPNVIDTLFIQKRDKEDNLVKNAVFALYDAVCDENGTGYFIAKNDVDTRYVRLAEDGSMIATAYTGTLSKDGIVTINEYSKRQVPYLVNQYGCADVQNLTTAEQIAETNGRIENNVAGNITIEIDDITYTITPAKDACPDELDKHHRTVAFTHDYCTRANEPGSAHLQYLKRGKYLLKEIYAPPGFKLNHTNVEVIVGNQEIYANAGMAGENDGIRVGTGAGYIMPTLDQFASIGDIDETLAYIVSTLRLKHNLNEESDGFTDISDSASWQYLWLDLNDMGKYIFNGDDPIGPIRGEDDNRATAIYLRYNGKILSDEEQSNDRTLFDYTINKEAYQKAENVINSDALAYWVESGWTRLALFQHDSGFNASGDSTSNYTDLTLKKVGDTYMENDISNLFANSTFVSFEDECDIGIKVHKVSSTTGENLANAGFTLTKSDGGEIYYYHENSQGNAEWTPEINTCYSDKNGLINYKNLEAGTYYLEEVDVPKGYFIPDKKIKITIAAGQVKAVWEGTGAPIETIAPDEDVGTPELSETGIFEGNRYVYTLELPNATGFELPKTGGAGTTLYYTCGILLIGASALMCGYKLRRKRGRGADG